MYMYSVGVRLTVRGIDRNNCHVNVSPSALCTCRPEGVCV